MVTFFTVGKATPLTAQLSDSLPPEVKIYLIGVRSQSLCSLLCGRINGFFEFPAMLYTDEGFPKWFAEIG